MENKRYEVFYRFHERGSKLMKHDSDTLRAKNKTEAKEKVHKHHNNRVITHYRVEEI